jgi:tRNA threonylcarbamoyladenosine biosynthesis protein TsaB
MLILALDTTTRPGSVALLRDGDLLAVESGDASQPHAERLPGEIVRLLSRHGFDVRAVDLFAVAAGPGSFTGLRIGIATMQGLAFALGRPVVGVSVLDALALLGADQVAMDDWAERGQPLVGAFMDAQRAEVFGALYEASGFRLQAPARGEDTEHEARASRLQVPAKARSPEPGASSVLDGPVSEPPAVVLARWQQISAGLPDAARGAKSERPIVFAGDGVVRYRSLIVERFGAGFRSVEPLPPLAGLIGRLALAEAADGRATAPHAVRPIYVRRSDAELAREGNRSHRGPGASAKGSDVRTD